MNEDTIKSLKDALKFSPKNVPLRLHLAETYLKMNLLEDAEKEFISALALESTKTGKFGLARVYFKKKDYSTCNVILEELIEDKTTNVNVLVLYSKALLKEGDITKAIAAYQEVLELDPTFEDEELDSVLRVPGSGHEAELWEEEDTNLFIQRPEIKFDHVGGMDDVKKEIEMKIILPLKHAEMYEAYGKKMGGGILLYGPPGCGKTHIAKATAGQVDARFINVGLSDILDMWIGNSEKNLHEVFEIARENTPCVLFFDEIDALGASRSDMKQSAGRHLINQFLQELDGVGNNNEGILILGATNTPWHLDPAFRRPGRFDRIIFVPPPDEAARIAIFKLKMDGKPQENIDYKKLGEKTAEYSGADIEAIIDIAIEEKLEASFKSGSPLPIRTKDLLSALKRHKASTKEWFATAKNFALYANEAGLYDDILTYMKIKK